MAGPEWIKLYLKTFRTSRKISAIERMKNGDTILVIWFKLLCLAGEINDGGAIYITPKIPFDSSSLADELNKPRAMVESAVKVFEEHDMIVKDDAGFIQIINWEKYQNIEGLEMIREYNRSAKKRSRELKKKAKEVSEMSMTCQVKVNENVNDMSMTCQGKVNECQDTDREGEKRDKDTHSTFGVVCERENARDAQVDAPSPAKKEAMGVFGNVYLTEEEQKAFADAHPVDYWRRIDRLSYYMKQTGKTYADHYAVLVSWSMEDAQKNPTQGSFDTEEFFSAALERSRRCAESGAEGDNGRSEADTKQCLCGAK